MAFLPYLNFGGNCREAFTRYHEIFGGDLTLLGMDQMPADQPVPPEHANLIMHAALMFQDGSLLMASDAMDADFGPVNGMYVNCGVHDFAEGKRVFDALSEGGKVDMEYAEAFFSPGYGICTDRFGTPWMITVNAPPA